MRVIKWINAQSIARLNDIKTFKINDQNINTVAVGGIIIAVAALYYQKKSYEVAKADVVVKPVEVKTEKKIGRFSII